MARPTRKPIQLKALAGTIRPDRDTGRADTSTCSLTKPPPPPDWMSEGARPEWDRLTKLLVANKLLPETATSFLAITCELHTHIINAFQSAEPPTASMLAQYRSYCSDFGLTPGMMGKVKPGGQVTPDNPFEKMKREMENDL